MSQKIDQNSLEFIYIQDNCSDDDSDLGNESDELPVVDLTKADSDEVKGGSERRSAKQPTSSHNLPGDNKYESMDNYRCVYI